MRMHILLVPGLVMFEDLSAQERAVDEHGAALVALLQDGPAPPMR